MRRQLCLHCRSTGSETAKHLAEWNDDGLNGDAQYLTQGVIGITSEGEQLPFYVQRYMRQATEFHVHIAWIAESGDRAEESVVRYESLELPAVQNQFGSAVKQDVPRIQEATEQGIELMVFIGIVHPGQEGKRRATWLIGDSEIRLQSLHECRNVIGY